MSISSGTFYNLRGKYAGLEVAEAKRLKVLAALYPRYGYLMLHGLLRGEGMVKNRKHTYRLYTEEGLQVRT